ncbi:unnamed protein product [Pleuronectes platessa]|uniref:Uncharacterized protein n=1 Tax=Pleuronectes platessa TaxID=8262 RepID=A0A9N7UDM7_PLEPL|nr:unnamed protein product [Pleuronectes platessa]
MATVVMVTGKRVGGLAYALQSSEWLEFNMAERTSSCVQAGDKAPSSSLSSPTLSEQSESLLEKPRGVSPCSPPPTSSPPCVPSSPPPLPPRPTAGLLEFKPGHVLAITLPQ